MVVVFTIILELIRLYVGFHVGSVLYSFYFVYIKKENLPDESMRPIVDIHLTILFITWTIAFAILTYMEYHLLMGWR